LATCCCVKPSRSSRWRAAATSVSWPGVDGRHLFQLLPARRADRGQLLRTPRASCDLPPAWPHGEVAHLRIRQLRAEDRRKRRPALHAGPSSTWILVRIPPAMGVTLTLLVRVRHDRARDCDSGTHIHHAEVAVLSPARATTSARSRSRHRRRPPLRDRAPTHPVPTWERVRPSSGWSGGEADREQRADRATTVNPRAVQSTAAHACVAPYRSAARRARARSRERCPTPV